jgi:hypothetical protein
MLLNVARQAEYQRKKAAKKRKAAWQNVDSLPLKRSG